MDADWSFCPVTKQYRDKAAHQLGSSGSGNHFAEFGTLTLTQDDLGLKAGVYCALLSHSGSRSTGGQVATYYSKLAMDLHPELPRELLQLAWLALASEAGQDVIVHRKGAMPAGKGVVGIIPGSMATPGYVVRGKGVPESMNSASHGAGRRMSRTATKNTYTWHDGKKFLADHDVVLISAELDEVRMGYKDIESVMAAQSDLVEIVARFDPKLVKMAPEGEQAED